MAAVPVPLSLLDRSRTRVGEVPAAALASTLDRAQRAERLGMRRFWVAEHHSVPGIASGSPPVLLASLAERTDSIRLGSGGVMLANHRPLVVAEQFAMLEALHPGRIDLGVGRSLGFIQSVREALGATSYSSDVFSADIAELRAYLAGGGPVRLVPEVPEAPPLHVLGNRSGIEIAAASGLPLVVGGPVLSDRPELVREYRDAFRPGPNGTEPHVIISLEIMVAETAERARELLLPEAWAMVNTRSIGEFGPLEPIADIRARDLTARQTERIERHLTGAVHGPPEQVAARVGALIEATGADEVMASTSTYDHEDLARADAAMAALFGG